MEKFGIFELLDTLTALTEEKDAQKEAPPPEKKSAPEEGAAPPARETPAKGKAGADALQGFLARHDAIARKADPGRKD